MGVILRLDDQFSKGAAGPSPIPDCLGLDPIDDDQDFMLAGFDFLRKMQDQRPVPRHFTFKRDRKHVESSLIIGSYFVSFCHAAGITPPRPLDLGLHGKIS
jgi:hypothetical protein